MMIINDKMISRVVKEVIREIHLPVVDNIPEVVNFVSSHWESPDDVWWLKIDARAKDVRNYNIRHPNQKKEWVRKSYLDSTSIDNHVGYVIVRGRNREECAKSILNAVVLLNPWAAREYGSRYAYSNGNAEAIKNICNFFYARAYITLNKRSMEEVLTTTRQLRGGNFKNGREFHRTIGKMRRPSDDSKVIYGLVDCDKNDANGQKELADYLAGKNIDVPIDKPSPDGVHKVIRVKDAEGLDFRFMDKYPTNNKPHDPNTKFKADASFLVYSALG